MQVCNEPAAQTCKHDVTQTLALAQQRRKPSRPFYNDARRDGFKVQKNLFEIYRDVRLRTRWRPRRQLPGRNQLGVEHQVELKTRGAGVRNTRGNQVGAAASRSGAVRLPQEDETPKEIDR